MSGLLRFAAPLLAGAALALAAAMPAAAHDYSAGALTIDHPWARPAIPDRPGAVFLTVKNAGNTADRLVGARTPVAGTVEVHTHIREGDMMRMVRVEAIDVPAGGMAMLQPGGDHLMLFDIQTPFALGDAFPLILIFEAAGEVEVEVQVEMGQAGQGHGHGHGHGMKKTN